VLCFHSSFHAVPLSQVVSLSVVGSPLVWPLSLSLFCLGGMIVVLFRVRLFACVWTGREKKSKRGIVWVAWRVLMFPSFRFSFFSLCLGVLVSFFLPSFLPFLPFSLALPLSLSLSSFLPFSFFAFFFLSLLFSFCL